MRRALQNLTAVLGAACALPDLFIDRSLGRIKVPNILRQAGLLSHSLQPVRT